MPAESTNSLSTSPSSSAQVKPHGSVAARVWSRSARVGFFLLLLTASGCGESRPQTFPARGKVVFADGKPVKLGTVELLSDVHKVNATGTIQKDGSFVLGTYTPDDGAVEGAHRVIVTQLIISDGMTTHIHDHGWPVDPFYGSYDSSPLNVTVSSETPNEFTLTVERAKSE